MPAPRRLTIASRRVVPASWQAEQVRQRLAELYPGTALSLIALEGHAEGERASMNERASMIKELETAIAEGRADLAVHALKNLPAELSPGFTIAGITARDDPRDAFVSRRFASLGEMPAGAVVGTSSLRRHAQLRERHPALVVKALRGDIEARLRALDAGRCDALIVASASLRRAGHGSRIGALLEPDESLPAPGQGALAIECRSDRRDLVAALAPLSDRATLLATAAERAFLRGLGGRETAPLAAYATWEEGALWLRGLVAGTRGGEVLRGEREAAVDDLEGAEALGRALADELLARGASRLLAS
ncbi:MAG: hydroxymethylbilane synthase [Burkholderiales bacterium]